MQPDRTAYLGIDLGTTNSAAVVFDGDTLHPIRASDGSALTPSVVRIDKRGTVTVGQRARRYLESDPHNTRSEFKRLMGTARALEFPASGQQHTPEELSAQVLRAIRADVADQLGFEPMRAVVSVPALFELPQSAATSEAARLAGFERIELIQEPVASALAAGWDAERDGSGAWMVYDIGGGTFDASLLETRDGLLRVVGHDGDNFLGGRDIDRAIVDWAIEQLGAEGVQVRRDDPSMQAALARLKTAAEEAKIDLSRQESTQLVLPSGLQVGDDLVEVDFTLSRSELEQLMEPLVKRSLDVCERLLTSHGLRSEQLERVVLVGGPTVIPYLRQRVSETLGAPAQDGMDPMTLVARGAALYAATADLQARPEPEACEPQATTGRRLWLQYPAMSSDLFPSVAGRVLDGEALAPTEVRFVRTDGGWSGEWEAVRPDGGLVAVLELRAGQRNTFDVQGRRHSEPVEVLPRQITVVQGMTITDPPLSRSVGVALADDRVRVYLERGTPLPAKRTFVHTTVQGVAKGQQGSVLAIPIVQGELSDAHLCRLVGRLDIDGEALQASLPAGSEVEVTVEVDRGGSLRAQALVPRLQQVFEHIAHLVVPDAPPETLQLQLDGLKTRLEAVRANAMRIEDVATIDQLYDVEWSLQDAHQDISAARGGDHDAGQKARRTLIETDARLGTIEDAGAWPELEAKAREHLAWAGRWVSANGSEQEQRLLAEAAEGVQRARDRRQASELERQLRVVDQLGTAAYFREPDAWHRSFEHASASISQATDLPQAQRLVEEGRSAVQRGDESRLREIVHALWRLLPATVQGERLGHGSGLS